MTKKPVKKSIDKRVATKKRALTFKQFCQQVERSNLRFDKATPAEKRCMVACDILKMLQLKRMNARRGVYVRMNVGPQTTKVIDSIQKGGKFQIQDLLKAHNVPACHVCAIGAAMVASTLRLDHASALARPPGAVVLAELYGDSEMSDMARDVFPAELLYCMEEVFECNEPFMKYGYEREIDYYRADDGDSWRLIAIYRNILKNKGRKFTSHGTGGKPLIARKDVIWESRL